MRSFAVVALIGAVSAAAVEYPQYPVESSTPAYEAYPVSSTPAYAVSTPAVSSSAKYEEYSASSSAASTPVYSEGYAVSSPAASSSAKYVEYPVTSTKVVQETTFVCPTPTIVTYEEKTYSVTKATTLTVSSYTTTVVETTKTPEAEKPSKTPEAETTKTPEAEKPSSKPEAPVYSATVPAPAPYPSSNGTVTHSAPQGTATGYPTAKPSSPEFTGAAAQAGVGLLAVVGALAAFL